MAKKLQEGEVCLPPDFLRHDFFLEEELSRRDEAGVARACFLDEFAMNGHSPAETEIDEEDYIFMAGLPRQMAHSFPQDGRSDPSALMASKRESGVMAGSLQSPLCGWSASESLVSLQPALSALEQHEELNYLSHGQSLITSAGCCTSPDLVHQQRLQAAQSHQLKRVQLMRQQLFAAWARQSKARGGGMGSCEGHQRGRPLGLSPSGRRPHQKQQQPQPGSGMRAVFLKRPDASREPAGTGVFLPPTAGDKSELRKKPACSTVLVPEMVDHLLKLNLKGQPEFGIDHDALTGRRNALLSHQKRNHHAPHPTADATMIHEIRLPQEWTY